MTPAEELRKAAERIREVAGKATPGPWINYCDGDRIIRDPDVTAREDDSDPCGEGAPLQYVVDEPLSYPENGDHIALWDPSVALLVAQTLDEQAEGWADDSETMQWFVAAPNGDDPTTAAPLYLLARAINGGAA